MRTELAMSQCFECPHTLEPIAQAEAHIDCDLCQPDSAWPDMLIESSSLALMSPGRACKHDPAICFASGQPMSYKNSV
jgi:hypothetical protein